MNAHRGPIYATDGLFRWLAGHPNARLIFVGAAMIAMPLAIGSFLSLLWNRVVVSFATVPGWFLWGHRWGMVVTSLAMMAGILIGPPLVVIGSMRAVRGKQSAKPTAPNPDTTP